MKRGAIGARGLSSFAGAALLATLACGCNKEASGDLIQLGGGVTVNAPKKLVHQEQRLHAPEAAYAMPDGSNPALFYRPGDPYDTEIERTLFLCAVSGAPRKIDGPTALAMGLPVDKKSTAHVTTDESHGVRTMIVMDPDENMARAYIDTGDLTATIDTSDHDSDGKALDLLRESLASLKRTPTVVFVPPTKEECAAALQRKKDVDADQIPLDRIREEVDAKAGGLFKVGFLGRRGCFVQVTAEPKDVVAYERAMALDMGSSGHLMERQQYGITLLGKKPGEATVHWSCDMAPPNAPDAKGVIKVHLH